MRAEYGVRDAYIQSAYRDSIKDGYTSSTLIYSTYNIHSEGVRHVKKRVREPSMLITEIYSQAKYI